MRPSDLDVIARIVGHLILAGVPTSSPAIETARGLAVDLRTALAERRRILGPEEHVAAH